MNPTPSQPERPEHNPDGLTPEQYGAPEFCLLRVGEMTRETDEYWSTCFEDWRQTNEEPKTLNPELDDTTYRRRVATRTPAPEAVAGEREPKCTCADWGMMDHTSDCAVTLWNRGREALQRASIRVSSTPPVEADKDAEKLRSLGQWLGNQRFDKAADITNSAADKLTTARATIAERDKRIESLVGALEKTQAFKTWVHEYLDKQNVPHHPPGTHGAEGCRIGDRMDWLMARVMAFDKALEITALAHAAEVKEQGMSTETPLTDAEAERFRSNLLGNTVVSTNFARSLERRNSELTARIAELEKAFQSEINSKNIAVNKWVGRLDEAESALAEARKDSAWQPIATAPKDGTKILVVAPMFQVGPELFQTVARFERELWLEGPLESSTEIWPPTHWMPLPATPHPETKEGQL